jgi:segregation and condensation protein A
MDYEVKLKIFEGPLDLLIHLIHKNEVDIFDIPISTITDQYLEYLDLMKALNVNLAGDFLVMAATLIHIKSKMLLPGSEEEEEEDDPRLEITRPLLEYMAFREIAQELSERDVLERDIFIRRTTPESEVSLREQEPQLDVSLFQLIDAFKRIVEQRVPGVQLKFRLERWSIKDKTELIIEHLREKGPIHFRDLFEEDRTLSELVVTFLALLELVHTGLVRLFQATWESDIRLIPTFGVRETENDGKNP